MKKDGFKGNYENWKIALDNSIGWDSNKILDKINKSTSHIINKPNYFEQDGEIKESTIINKPILLSLLMSINFKTNTLNLIDFGGSLGSHYHRYKYLLNKEIDVKWSVVEQLNYVELGKKNYQTNNLRFYDSIKEACVEMNPSLFLSSGTIQYIENTKELIHSILEQNFDHIILDRIFFINDTKNRIVTQHATQEVFYEASFPTWLFNEASFIKQFDEKYNLVFDFNSEDPDNSIDKFRIYHKGFYFQKKTLKN